MTQAISRSESTRFHELDALRVIAFGVLILYHIGMYYVLEWGWHIKSEQPQAWLQDVMILTNQWRMSLLFLISSMVLTVLLTRVEPKPLLFLKRAGKLIIQRTQRLMIPLLFGMFVIVAPQVYIEWTVNGVIDTPLLVGVFLIVNFAVSDNGSVGKTPDWNNKLFFCILYSNGRNMANAAKYIPHYTRFAK